MRRHLKAIFLLLALATTGVSLSACDTIQDAFESVRDTVD